MNNKKHKPITSDHMSRAFVIETAVFVGLMAICALGLTYTFIQLLLFFLGGITVSGPFFLTA